MPKDSDKDDDVHLVFKSLAGETLGEMQVKSSATIGAIAQKLAESRKLCRNKFYHLFLGVEMMESGDALRAHISGDKAELIAHEDEDSEESVDCASDSSSSKRKKNKKDKSKKKDSKSKKKKKGSKAKEEKVKKKSSKKRKKSSSSSSSVDGVEKDPLAKDAWIAERLEALRNVRPPLSAELRVIRAQKEWKEHKKKMGKEQEAKELAKYPPMVREAMQQAEEEAKAAGKDALAVKEEVERAKEFALKVAKQNGLYKEFHDLEDPSKVPMMFQKRAGLEKTLAYLNKDT